MSDAAQNALSLKDILIPLISIGGAVIVAVIGSHLTLQNFFKQRRWERKADAYTAIFEAVHNVERWYEKHLEAAQQERDIGDERKRRLQEEANKAEEDLERCLAGQIWNLPEDFRRRAGRLTSNLSTFGEPGMSLPPNCQSGTATDAA